MFDVKSELYNDVFLNGTDNNEGMFWFSKLNSYKFNQISNHECSLTFILF